MKHATLKTLIAVIMVFATINSAMAATNITLNPNSYFKRINSDTVATFNNTDQLIYIDSTGITDIINTSPYNARRFVEWGVVPQPETIYDVDELYYIDPDTKELVNADRETDSINTYNLSSSLTYSYYLNRLRLVAMVAPYNTLIYSYQGNSNPNYAYAKIEGLNNQSFLGIGGACLEGATYYSGSCGTVTIHCGKTFVEYDGEGYSLWTEEFRTCNTDTSVVLQRQYYNGTTGAMTTIDYNPEFRGYGWDNDAATPDPHPGFCYEDDDYIYCSRGYEPQNYFQQDKYNMTNAYSIGDAGITYGSETIYPLFADSNDHNTLYVDNASNLRFAIGGNLTSVEIPVSRKAQFDHAVLEDAFIYHLGTSDDYVFVTEAEVSNYTAPTTNQTYNNATTIQTYNYSGVTSLELIGNNKSLLGVEEELFLYDYNNPEIIISTDSVDTNHLIYSTSTYSSNVMVGTNNGIYTYDLATLTEQYNDKWGLFHADRAYSVSTLSDNAAWVCDNHNEPDYYAVGNDPVGNLGTGCYDLSTDLSELYLFVDIEDGGILSIDISNSTNPSIDDNIDLIDERYDQDYGDLLDYLDTADEDLLLAITGYLTFTAIDTSNKASLSEVTECNSAGAGYITAVELISEDLAIAGTHNGRILFCDLNNPDYQTNTEWYSIEGLEGESVKGIEYDGELIHAISDNHYVIMSYEEESVETNTPPYIDTFTVSDYNPDINQTVVIDITPGNVEPVDVIKYGMKCIGNETDYTTNLEGSFECIYSLAGIYYAEIAITDNYHYPTFYDSQYLEIIVTEEGFTGGILTVEVSDPLNSIYVVGAVVEANNKTANTNDFGRATITTDEPITYATTITKSGYQTKVVSLEANTDVHYVQLFSTAASNESALSVTVEDDAGNPIEGALVSYTHTTTYNYAYTWTDANGKAYFTPVDAGTVSLQASATNYDDQNILVTIPSYGTATATIVLPLLSEAYLGNLHADRDCIDNGIWLCGEANVVEHSCTQDSDCLSDFCTPGINRCSRFNYSVCDENDMARDQRCVTKFTFEGGMGGVTNFMLTNLLWIVILLIILIAAGLVFFSWNK